MSRHHGSAEIQWGPGHAATYIRDVAAGTGPRVVAAQVAGDRTGRVVAVRTGLVLVTVRNRVVRTTVGAELLADMARDDSAGPRVGDRVRVRCWADGRTTLEQVVERAEG